MLSTFSQFSSMIPVMEQKKVGRPRKINPFIARKICLLYSFGLTDEQISYVFGIHRDTVSEFKKNPEYSDTIKGCKEKADLAVINALYKRAVGMTLIERRVVNGIEFAVEKQLPPDVTACIFWLKNRRPTEWRDKPQYDQEKNDNEYQSFVSRLFKPIMEKEQKRIAAGEDSVEVLLGKDFVEKVRAENNIQT